MEVIEQVIAFRLRERTLLRMIDEEKLTPDWLNDNWLRDHLAYLPLGTFVVTWFLVAVPGGEWQWWDRDGIVMVGQVAPFGAAVYGTGMYMWEKLGGPVWDRITRKKAIEKAREEGEERGSRQGHEEGYRSGYEDGLMQVRQEGSSTIVV